jgi:hypothetical protein
MNISDSSLNPWIDAGLLTIPVQTWETKPSTGNTNSAGLISTANILELEEDEESVLIRRVGFVFLAYNVEYWCVARI